MADDTSVYTADCDPARASFEHQTMVRRVKTYTIVDSEFSLLTATGVLANVLGFIASIAAAVALDCWISGMAIPPGIQLSDTQQLFFTYGPKIGLIVASAFSVLTVLTWAYGFSVLRNVRKTSREGRVVSS